MSNLGVVSCEMKILWLTNIPSPYRVSFFNELGKKTKLAVAFERRFSEDRDDIWKNYSFNTFNGHFLGGIKVGSNKALAISVAKLINIYKNDVIIVQNPATPTGIFALLYMKLKGISYYIESDGAFPASAKGIKEAFKRFLFSGAAGYFSTSEMSDKYFKKYVKDYTKIFRYPFSSISDAAIIEIDSILSVNEKQQIAEIRQNSTNVVLSVGQFIHRKGFDVLLKAAITFPDQTIIYIVGGKVTDEYMTLVKDMGLTNVHFVDFLSTNDLKYYFLACDVFVLPTREDVWGLVVNEAMAHGCPIVTTDRCVAGLEMIKNGENGFLVPVEDVKELGKKINEILANSEVKEKMRKGAVLTAKEYTIEKMAESHYQILRDIT